MELERISTLYKEALDEIGKVIVGQVELVEGILTALFSEGSVLIEGPPGLGKTLLVNVLQRVVSCEGKRVQFTPDLMPSDLTGHNVYDMSEKKFHFNKGPIFANLLLCDEINRSPPKTQSALLEVMQEYQVTVDGTRYEIPRPFLVLATQNPLEHEGTYPLPEAQVDRFMFKLLVDYPSPREEVDILAHYATGKNFKNLESFGVQPVLQAEDILDIQRSVTQVHVEHQVIDYIAKIVAKTRAWPSLSVGASPRGSVSLLIAARTIAACRNRDFVTPDDVKEVAPWVLRHRIRLRPEAEIEGLSPDEVVQQVLDSVEVPRS